MNNTSITIANARVTRAPKTFGEGKNAVTVVTVAVNPIGEKAKERYLSSFYEVRCGGIFAARAAELEVGDTVSAIVGPVAEYEYEGKNGKVKQLTIPFPTVFATPFKTKKDEASFEPVETEAPDPFGLG